MTTRKQKEFDCDYLNQTFSQYFQYFKEYMVEIEHEEKDEVKQALDLSYKDNHKNDKIHG